MQITTTNREGKAWSPKAKPFAWSYSRLKNYEACPKKHFHVDIKRDVKEEEGEALIWGNAVHKALADRLDPKKRTNLPVPMQGYEHWCRKIEGNGEGTLLVEQQLAITKNYGATEWFGKDAWYRGIADVLKIVGPVALAVDWKTGKILEEPVQLALMACCVFAHHPEVQKVRAEYIWLKEDASSRAIISREDMPGLWASLWPRVSALEQAHETQNYPPLPGGLCRRYCPVKTCQHWGG
jgi:hypothetical protein